MVTTTRFYASQTRTANFWTGASNVLGDTPNTFGYMNSSNSFGEWSVDTSSVPSDATIQEIKYGIRLSAANGLARPGRLRCSLYDGIYPKSYIDVKAAQGDTSLQTFQTSTTTIGLTEILGNNLRMQVEPRETDSEQNNVHGLYIEVTYEGGTPPPPTTTEELYASSHITGDVLSPDNALGPIDGVGTTNTGKSGWTSRWAMDDPSAPLVGAQTIQVVLRKSDTTGQNPTVDVDLYENGSKIADLGNGTIPNTTWTQYNIGTFDASVIADPANVEIWISASETYQSAIQVDAILWIANIEVASSKINVWTGTEWKPLTVWDGSAWNDKVSVWTGTEWVT